MRSSVATETIIQDAEHFEAWLLRKGRVTWLDVSTLDDPSPVLIPGHGDPATARAKCGAFHRPPWYTDAMQAARPWLECNGRHEPLTGWHCSDNGDQFASHHFVAGSGHKCSCGVDDFPCPQSSTTDMRT